MKAETRADPLAFCHDSILSIAQDLLRCCNACAKSPAIAGSRIIMETIASMSSETTKPANNASDCPIVGRQCFLSACYTKSFHAIRLVAHSFLSVACYPYSSFSRFLSNLRRLYCGV
jgi:hypothetical protein